MADFFARISSQASAASAQAATMSFSTVTGTAGVLPTPSSCASRSVNFASGANTAGCTFSPQGDDISPYKSCCKSAPLLSYADSCGFYCKAQGQSLDALQKCLSNIGNTGSIACQSNSNSGEGNDVSQFSSGGGGNVNTGGSSSSSSSGPSDDGNDDFDDDFFNDDDEEDNDDDDDDSQDGGSTVVASTAAIAGPGQTAIARTSAGPNGASGTGTTINGFPLPSGVAAPSGGVFNFNGGQGNQGGSDVVASTAAVAGPGQTAIASTSAGPAGVAGFGTTIGGVAAPSGFAENPSGGAPFPQGNSTGNFIASNTPAGSPTGTAPLQSFTGAAASVRAPGAGISKGGLLTVGLLVFGAFTGAML